MNIRLVAAAAVVTLAAALAGCSGATTVSPKQPQTTTAPVGTSRAVSGSVWVADEGGESLTVVDAATNTVAMTVTGIKGPHNVQIGRAGGATVYAVSEGNTVMAIDAATYTVAAVAATGSAPAHVIEAPNGKVYVSNSGDGTVSVYQARGLEATGRIDLGGMPHGLRPAAGGSLIVVANTMAGTVDLIDCQRSVLGSVPVGPPGPAQVAVTADGRYAYAGITDPPAVVKVDLTARKVVGTAQVSAAPAQVYLTPDEATVLSADQGTAEKARTCAVGDRYRSNDHSRHCRHRLGGATRSSHRHFRNAGMGHKHLRQHGLRHRPAQPVDCGDNRCRHRSQRGGQLHVAPSGRIRHNDRHAGHPPHNPRASKTTLRTINQGGHE